MKIFVSWSGERSKELARLLKDWLPKVIQECDPWFSEKDIPSGAPWPTEISNNLNRARFGIMCVTPENLNAPWLFFEAGALTSRMKKDRLVCPLLLGMEKDKLGTPLGLFQSRIASDEKDMLLLLKNINDNCDGKKLEEKILEEAFEKYKAEFFDEVKKMEKKRPLMRPKQGEVPGVSFDCTQEEFINHLSRCKEVTILGITNRNLNDYLNKAWKKREKVNPEPWNKVEIIFPAQHLLKDMPFPDVSAEVRSIGYLNHQWEDGVEKARKFLRSSTNPENPEGYRARFVEIRSYDKPFPFVGQIYDDNRIRVTYILPDKDIRSSCYMNLVRSTPPCKNHGVQPASLLEEADSPPCKKQDAAAVACESCTWEQAHSPCHAIYNTFKTISTASTPLLAANIVGWIGNREKPDSLKFRFSTLRPQNNWRKTFKSADPDRPVHLLSFILLRYDHQACLLLRNEKNSSGEFNKFGVLPGKVNDIDFFDGLADEAYREQVYKMQKAWDRRETDPTYSAFLASSKKASELFAKHLNIQVGQAIGSATLNAACTRAAIRSIREKIGLEIPASRLKLRKKTYTVLQGDYELFIRCFVLDLGKSELGYITNPDFSRQRAEDLKKLKVEGRLTDFLTKYTGDILEILKA
jgi:hypothetical protein